MAIIGLLTDGIIKSGSATGDILNRSRAISKSSSTIIACFLEGQGRPHCSITSLFHLHTKIFHTKTLPLEKTKNKSMYGMNENQNVFMDGKRTTSRVTNEPGGKSSVQLGWDSPKSERNLLCLLFIFDFTLLLFLTYFVSYLNTLLSTIHSNQLLRRSQS